MIIDFHIHYYPEKIVERAMSSAEKLFTPAIGGRKADLLRSMQESGVDISLLLPLVNTPANCKAINDWAKGETGDKILSFGSVHPADEKALEHLVRLKNQGFRGIKVHPEYQGFSFSDRRYFPVWECCSELGMPVLTHAGFDISFPPPFRTNPRELRDFHRSFPRLTLILAHLGGLRMYDAVEEYLLKEDVFLDTAYIAEEDLPPQMLARFIGRHGSERILFGSDSPWAGQKKAVECIDSLNITAAAKENIFYRNAASLLGLDVR